LNTRPHIPGVDEEYTVCDLLSEDFADQGYQCTGVSDTIEALKEMQKWHSDVALSGIKVPGMSGLESLRALSEHGHNTAAIVRTCVCNADIIVEALRLGVLRYVVEPFDFDELAAVSVSINRQLGLPQHDIENIGIAVLVPDIGMIRVNESIAGSEHYLDWQRFRRIAYRSEAEEQMLGHAAKNYETQSIVRHHHERYDGKGYSDGLYDEQIPLDARILTLADAYDAMRSERYYRPAMSAGTGRAEIQVCKGHQSDPEVAEAFPRTETVSRVVVSCQRLEKSGLPESGR
jgi:response regulator RpfG family c-di-GMP phosphodiesterase